MFDEPRRPAARGDTTPAAPATRSDLLHSDLVRRIIRASHVLHQELGMGFLESVYEAGLAKLLRDTGITVERQHALDVVFRGEVLGSFRADLVVERLVIVELKVVKELLPIHEAQLLNYMRASGIRVGVLVNFARRLEYKRLVL